MIDRVRLYGKTVNEWKHTVERNGREVEVVCQTEEAYKEYSLEDGSLVMVGTEDFASGRYREEIEKGFVWTWDGKKYNKGGKRSFECRDFVIYKKSERKQVREYLKKKYPDSKEIQLRKV